MIWGLAAALSTLQSTFRGRLPAWRWAFCRRGSVDMGACPGHTRCNSPLLLCLQGDLYEGMDGFDDDPTRYADQDMYDQQPGTPRAAGAPEDDYQQQVCHASAGAAT